jgi:hypothetical protein
MGETMSKRRRFLSSDPYRARYYAETCALAVIFIAAMLGLYAGLYAAVYGHLPPWS